MMNARLRPITLAIVGRPNVGKSSLFNRVAGHRVALVEDLPGTTRDRVSLNLDWHGRTLRLVDTGGLETSSTALYPSLIRRQIETAMQEADAILFVVDGRDGLTSEDFAVADLLRQARQPVLLVANKVDNERRELDAVQFYELGLGDPIPVSAFHGHGISDLIDEALARADIHTEDAPEQAAGPALAIVGRPNAGKSMLLNALVGEERVIVSDLPGTTRDAIDTVLEFEGQQLTLIDTAGIRRRGHIEQGVERHSVLRAQDAIERSDVALVLMDSTDPATAQDLHVVQLAEEAHKGLIIVLSKADLIRSRELRQDLLRQIRLRLRFAPWAPILFTSARERTGLPELLQLAIRIKQQRTLRVATGPLNNLLQRAMADHPPGSVQGRRLKLLYATQAGVAPPTFVLFVNDATLLHFTYRRYLENRLRQAYGFEGTAIRFVFKSRSDVPAAERELAHLIEAESPVTERRHVSAAPGTRRPARRSRR